MKPHFMTPWIYVQGFTLVCELLLYISDIFSGIETPSCHELAMFLLIYFNLESVWCIRKIFVHAISLDNVGCYSLFWTNKFYVICIKSFILQFNLISLQLISSLRLIGSETCIVNWLQINVIQFFIFLNFPYSSVFSCSSGIINTIPCCYTTPRTYI